MAGWQDVYKRQTNAYDNYYLSMPYMKAIQESKFTQKELDDKVRRVLRLFYRTTMKDVYKRQTSCSTSPETYDRCSCHPNA